MSTVKFTPNSKTTNISLASMPGSEIEIRSSLSIGEKRNVIGKYSKLEKDDPEASKAIIDMITVSIVKWNFTDEDDKPLAITEDIIDQLSENDIKELSKAIGIDIDKAMAEEEKKGE
jgi:hypothetical protein